ncbi:hypothetical protein PS943_03279 [Pseudomonas fluorescens]|uniref:Uncharacterized protein n=1 Tax=Pseudomonas fluorescens TaxID=294 RepID=A0A5E7WEE6_PSEFL|nr:hypothetical protein PS943_03279 [Pseudomonas fluorescens]
MCRRKTRKPASKQVQDSATQIATQQVSEATRISDNVDEAFAKTRVGLQASSAQLPGGVETATNAFKEYMSKTPEERLQDKIKLAQAEKENNSSQVVDKFLASL